MSGQKLTSAAKKLAGRNVCKHGMSSDFACKIAVSAQRSDTDWPVSWPPFASPRTQVRRCEPPENFNRAQRFITCTRVRVTSAGLRHRPCPYISRSETTTDEKSLAQESASEPRIGRSVSLDHAARMLGVSRRTIYNRIRDGHLQTIRTLGGSQRVLSTRCRLPTPVVRRISFRTIWRPRHSASRRSNYFLLSGVLRMVFVNRLSFTSRRVLTSVSFVLVLLVTPGVVYAAGASRAAERGSRRSPGGRLADDSTSSSTAIAAEINALAGRYNLKRQEGAQERRRRDGERRSARRAAAGRGGRSPVGRHPDSVVADVTAEAIGADQVWAGSGAGAAAQRPRRHRGGDRFGHRHAAQRVPAGPRRLHEGLHRRRRHGPVRPRHARGGDHRRPARPARRDARLSRASRPARISSTCACSATMGRGWRAM